LEVPESSNDQEIINIKSVDDLSKYPIHDKFLNKALLWKNDGERDFYGNYLYTSNRKKDESGEFTEFTPQSDKPN